MVRSALHLSAVAKGGAIPDDAKIDSLKPDRNLVNAAWASLDRGGFQWLDFRSVLEDKFEADTRQARSHRMWFEGLVAILGLNFCLMLDYAIVREARWLSVVEHTASITPLALAVNFLVKKNPPGWLREGSIAVAMFAISLLNLVIQGNATTTATLYGTICVVITALFAGVVMRLRLPYMLASVVAMLLAAMISLGHARTMRLSEIVVGGSLLLVGLGIIVVAGYSLEREERRNYLLCLQRELQAAELELSNRALERLSNMDKLTGLPNRRAFEDRAEQLWAACAAKGQPLSAVLVDVDHFKRINDARGHLYGDETLRRIGSLLPKALRSSEDFAARFGGEEFVLLLRGTEIEASVGVADRVRQTVESAGTLPEPGSLRDAGMWVTVSCGVSCCVPTEGSSWRDLIAAADEALYAAKRGGRNKVEFCTRLGDTLRSEQQAVCLDRKTDSFRSLEAGLRKHPPTLIQ